MTSENPRTVRLTRGKITKANFGAQLGRVVSLTIGDKLFDGCTPYVKKATEEDLIQLMPKLLAEKSIVKVTYYAINSPHDLAEERLENFVDLLDHIWEDVAEEPYRLEIEDELIHDGRSVACDAEAEVIIHKPQPIVKSKVTPGRKIIYRQFRVYFKHDKYSLTDSAQGILRDVKRYIGDHGYDRISLEGHADKSGNVEYNKKLAKNRNRSVRGWLDSKVGGLRYSNSSFGEDSSPIKTPDGVKEVGNRVVFITIEHDEPM